MGFAENAALTAADNPYRIPVGAFCARKRERDSTEYAKQTIMEALNHEGCPACQLIKEREEKSFWWFFNDNYHEVPVLTDLMDNSFLCDYHANILGSGDHGSLAFVFQFLVQADINRLGELSGVLNQEKPNSLSGYFQRNKGKSEQSRIIDDHLKGYLSCRFCKLNENASQYIEGLFAELVQEDAAFRDLYQESHGLCRRHFIEVLKLCGDKAAADFLLNDMIRRLKEMKDHFDLYFHRLDYRFAAETKGEEQNTWLRALRYYSSDKTDGSDRK